MLILAGLLLSGCTSQTNTSATGDTTPAPQLGQVSVTLQALEGSALLCGGETAFAEGTNAFDAMKEACELTYEEYPFGVYITSIEGVQPKENEYWALYVNGAYAEKGISDYALEDGMELEWRIETLK